GHPVTCQPAPELLTPPHGEQRQQPGGGQRRPGEEVQEHRPGALRLVRAQLGTTPALVGRALVGRALVGRALVAGATAPLTVRAPLAGALLSPAVTVLAAPVVGTAPVLFGRAPVALLPVGGLLGR